MANNGDPLYTLTGTHASRAVMAENLKIQYEKEIQNQYADKDQGTLLYNIISKNPGNKIEGKQLSFAIQGELGGNWTAIGEDGYAKAPWRRDVIPGYVTIAGYQMSSMGISIPLEISSKNSDAVYLDVSAEVVSECTERMKRHIGRQFIGDGSCVLCKTSDWTSTTLTVDTTYYPKTTRHLRVGDDVSFWTDATSYNTYLYNGVGSTVYTTKVTDIISDTQFAVAARPSDATHVVYVCFHGSRDFSGSTAVFHEMSGLEKICSTSTTYLQINPATAGQRSWKAIVDMNGGTPRAYDPDLILDAVSTAQDGGINPDYWLCSKEMRAIHDKIQSGLVRIGLGDTGEIRRNNPALVMPNSNDTGEISLKPMMNKFVTPGDNYIFDSKQVKLLSYIDNKFLDKDMMAHVPRSLFKEGQLCNASEIWTKRRNAFVKVGDFSTTLQSYPR